MVFSSPYFLFLFLPLALAICLSLKRAGYLHAIFAVSVFFYFWSAGRHTLILVGLIFGNYLGALWIGRRRGKALFAALVVGNLLVLFWYKYAGFVFRNVDALLGTELAILAKGVVLPAGVSFFVFQAISYLIDVRRRDIEAERRLVTYAAYQAFFPHLIAGPIVRFRDVIGDLLAPRLSPALFAAGITRFTHGLLKKTLIADGVAPIANVVFSAPASGLDFITGWLGAIAYAIQIYFDFSGYSDMAIGLAQMFGVRFHENFERPYSSRSITEFWRRWHISLSSWFRDYLYVPLGGNRRGTWRTYRNLLIVFVVTGLWHGAAWTFLLWGLYHGCFLIIERAMWRDPIKVMRHWATRYVYCLPVVIFGWVLFRAPTLSSTLDLWNVMLSPASSASLAELASRTAMTPYRATALLAGAAIFLLPGQTSAGLRLMDAPENARVRAFSTAYTLLALALVSMLVLTSGYSPFLYFNF